MAKIGKILPFFPPQQIIWWQKTDPWQGIIAKSSTVKRQLHHGSLQTCCVSCFYHV